MGDAAEAFEEDVDAPEPGYARAVGWTICGVLSAWGRIEVHQEGFRAQRARLEALFLPSNWAGSAYHEAIEAVARLYGVPAVEHEPESLIETCRRRWPGLDPDLVDELLVAELEVALTPATNSLILREGETVAGAGYVVEGHRYKPWFWDAEWPLEERGLRVVRVAGTGFTGDAIERDEFAPLKPVRLVAEPENEQDADAVAIYDESGSVRGGYVPRGIASDVKRDLESGRLGRARVVWHWRDLASGRRTGLCVMIPRRRLPVRVVDAPEVDVLEPDALDGPTFAIDDLK